MTHRPPRLAEWLLEFLGFARQNRALMGDLLEEIRNGRSAGWYWRQTWMIVWSGIGKNAPGPLCYFGAALIGFGAQTALTFTLWRLHSVAADGMAALLGLCLYTVVGRKQKRLTGSFFGNYERLLITGEMAAQSRPAASRLVFLETFNGYLWLYFVHDLWILKHLSLLQLTGVQAAWFGVSSFVPALFWAHWAATRAENPADGEWSGYPRPLLGLSVLLGDGSTILLRPENLAQTVFATADEELISAVFGGHASLELVRRALWLGGSGWSIPGYIRPGPVPVSRLASLIAETARQQPLVQPARRGKITNRFRTRRKR